MDYLVDHSIYFYLMGEFEFFFGFFWGGGFGLLFGVVVGTLGVGLGLGLAGSVERRDVMSCASREGFLHEGIRVCFLMTDTDRLNCSMRMLE